MNAMFPASGVPAIDAKNTLLDPATVNCDELWYSTSRCQPRFDPAAANAQLAELINLVNCGGIAYDCDKLDNLCTAVKYLIRSGAASCMPLTGGPSTYTGTLDPPLLAYPTDCCMLVVAIPNVANDGAVSINIPPLSYLPVVRNDGQALRPNDWKPGIPTPLVYCNGHWVNVSMLPSQLPSVLGPNMVLYVNAVTGDDTAYDGTSATVIGGTGKGPFKTIQRAVDRTFEYGPSAYSMSIMVSAGTYPESVFSKNFQGPTIVMTGAGKQQTFVTGSANQHTFTWFAGNQIFINDLHVSTGTNPNCCGFAAITGGAITTNRTASGFCAFNVWESYGGYVIMGTHDFDAGSSVGTSIAGAYFGGFAAWSLNVVWTFLGAMTVGGATISAGSNGSMQVPVPGSPVFVNPGYVTGAKYAAQLNGVLNVQGLGINYFPGSTAGYTSSGGQYL
jgi:Pectinesterase